MREWCWQRVNDVLDRVDNVNWDMMFMWSWLLISIGTVLAGGYYGR